MAVETIFPYMGNKTDMVDFIEPYIPSHKIYCEVFGGTMAVLLNKRKSQFIKEVYNDRNTMLTNMFEIIRTRKEEFVENLNELYVSELLHEKMRYRFKEWEPSKENSMEDAVAFFYVMMFTFGGKFTGGFGWQNSTRFGYLIDNKIPAINAIHNRIKNVEIVNKDYSYLINKFNNEDSFLYLDPPYVSSETYYEFAAGAFDEQEHIKMRDQLSSFKGKYMISYEESELVRDLYSNHTILSMSKFRQSKGGSAEEIIVMNYKKEPTLFDLKK